MASFISDASDRTLLDAFRKNHGLSYTEVVHGCCDALGVVWTEMGVHSRDVQSELIKIAEGVTQVWQSAVKEAENQRDAYHRQIHEVESEMHAIQAQLGEAAETVRMTPEMTLKQRLEAVKERKEQCMVMKRKRIAEFKAILETVEVIRQQFGQGQEPQIDFDGPQCNITLTNLDFLKCELESFWAERSGRLERLESLWTPLKAKCTELGEDPSEIAKSVHPTFEFIEQGLSGKSIAVPSERLPSLSDTSLLLLEEKLAWLAKERSKREIELLSMKETLLNLWDALNTPADDLDRSILCRLMEGPMRLHRRTFKNIHEAIHRQEVAKAQFLKELVWNKIEQIQHICEEGHLTLPTDVQEVKSEESSTHYADKLAHLTRMLTELTTLSEKRSEILTLIKDLEFARSETDWLAKYEEDGDRYKGRDCNRKLQRAIKAGKLRDRMASLVEKLMTAILEWERKEHQPFVFDGLDYRKQVLERYDTHGSVTPVSARNGRKTPSGRRSAIPDYPTPSQSARGAAKHRMTPTRSDSKSLVFGEGKSLTVRPQTSFGYASKENGVEHLLKNTQTDYHPLQERLDRLLGSGDVSSSLKSRIPMPKTIKHDAVCMPVPCNKDPQDTSEDEMMEDVIPAVSVPPPRLNLSALNKDPSLDLSQRRTTF